MQSMEALIICPYETYKYILDPQILCCKETSETTNFYF